MDFNEAPDIMSAGRHHREWNYNFVMRGVKFL